MARLVEFNGNKISIDMEKKQIVLNDQYVFILVRYAHEMPLKAFVISIGSFELGKDDKLIGNNSGNNIRQEPFRDSYYEFFKQDWVVEDFKQMAMANNACENELAHYLGETINVFLNKYKMDGVTEEFVECYPLYLAYSEGVFTVNNNPNTTDNISLFVGETKDSMTEYMMNVVNGNYEYELTLAPGEYIYYTVNNTVGNRSAYKTIAITDEIE